MPRGDLPVPPASTKIVDGFSDVRTFSLVANGLTTLRILVVQDHLRMRIPVKQMLSASGVTSIEEAVNNAEARQFLHDPST